MNDQQSQTESGHAAEMQQGMIDTLVNEGSITNTLVEAAFRAVPRHIFLPGHPLEEVYRNEAIVTKRQGEMPISSSSQPSMMAIMLEQLDLRPGDRALEIGTATGYNAALMSHITGSTGSVVTIDIDEELVESAREHLAEAGFGDVKVVARDGSLGYPEGAPYDRIIVTVGAWDIPPAWLEQLAPGGRIVLPIGLAGDCQESIAFERDGDRLIGISHRGCGFVHMQGAFARPAGKDVTIDAIPGVRVRLDDADTLRVETGAIATMLRGRCGDIETGVTVTEQELFGQTLRWLAFTIPELLTLMATGLAVDHDFLPYLFGSAGSLRMATGIVAPEGMAFLIRRPGDPLPEGRPDWGAPVELWVRSYGENDAPARRLIDAITRWDRSNRPSFTSGMRIEAYTDAGSYHPSPGDYVIERDHIIIVLKPR